MWKDAPPPRLGDPSPPSPLSQQPLELRLYQREQRSSFSSRSSAARLWAQGPRSAGSMAGAGRGSFPERTLGCRFCSIAPSSRERRAAGLRSGPQPHGFPRFGPQDAWGPGSAAVTPLNPRAPGRWAGLEDTPAAGRGPAAAGGLRCAGKDRRRESRRELNETLISGSKRSGAPQRNFPHGKITNCKL